MYYCVAYDISNDRLRLKTIKRIKQAGLVRLQKSVFTGRSTPDRMADLQAQVQALIAPTDRFCIIPLDRLAWENLVLIGKNDSKKILARQVPITIF